MKKKILFIWHAAVVESYQKYIAELAEYDDLDITLLVPQYSIEGSRKVKAHVPKNAKYKVIVGYAINPQDPLLSIYPLLPYYLWKTKPDLIHLFEEPWHNNAAYLNFWIKKICPRAKLIFQTLQNQVKDYPNNWINIQNQTYKYSSAAIACAEEMKKVLLHWKYNKPIHTIYLGIETKLFSPKDSTKLRQKLGLNKFTIGYFGRMLKEKGPEDLLAASKKLNFPHQLLFVGDGKDKEELKKQAKNAIWLDPVPLEELPNYYAATNLLTLPSRTTPKWKEQFGRVLVEAMLCGTPIIGSSSGEIPNVIGDAGLIFKEQDPSDLAEKISKIYKDQQLRQELINNGFKRGKEFDWSSITQKVYSVYKEIFNEKP